jgi:hypothetical protein
VSGSTTPLAAHRLQEGVRFHPHALLDAVDDHLKIVTKHGMRSALGRAPALPFRELGVTRTGLLSALRGACWEHTLRDRALIQEAPVLDDAVLEALLQDKYPSVSISEFVRDGSWSFGRVKRLLAACTSSRAQCLLLQTLTGSRFKGLENGVIVRRHQQFLAAVVTEVGADWVEQLPAACNSFAAGEAPPAGLLEV